MATSKELPKNGDTNEYILGIDLGTTSVKTALLNYNTKEILAQENVEHFASIEQEKTSQKHEQVVHKIFLALNKCIELLPREILWHVKETVVCGQMHGCVLWKNEKLMSKSLSMQDKLESIKNDFTSTLVTWQDGRCSPEFLSSLPKTSGDSSLASGFGCATLFWLQYHSPDMVKQYDCAGTIMDLLVTCLCSNSVSVYMSSQNANSWGYFDVENRTWELEKLASSNFPTHMLPEICRPGDIAGHLARPWHDIPSGTTVRVALGDMQCSIFATMSGLGDAVMNIGTSIQLSVIVNESVKNGISQEVSVNPALHFVPYFNDHCLVVAAALTGGNALAFFVKMLQSWVRDLGLEVPFGDEIYRKLCECGEREDLAKLTISPVLWGERHNPEQTAMVTDISPTSLSLGNIYRSLCHGLIMNVFSMMSKNFLELCNVQKIVGTGNALVRNKLLQESIKEISGLPFQLCENSDASVGAALSSLDIPFLLLPKLAKNCS